MAGSTSSNRSRPGRERRHRPAILRSPFRDYAPIPHVILNVTDMAATVAAINAAGGSMDGDPRPFGNTGIVIGIAVDPAGNRLELIQRK